MYKQKKSTNQHNQDNLCSTERQLIQTTHSHSLSVKMNAFSFLSKSIAENFKHLSPNHCSVSLSHTDKHTLTDRHTSSTCPLLKDGCRGLSLMLALSDGPHGGCCWKSSACCMCSLTLCLSVRCLHVPLETITGLTNARRHYITNR